jgi:eukaryotic-like serine/threonine-protein kinase
MECLACHTPNIDGARFCAKCGAPLPIQKAADADPLIGKTVGGRYRIMGILGEGGMGRVYNGEQQMGTSVRKVAVKTLLSQFAKDPQTVARFMREVGTVSELEHPNTIKVYDFGQIEGSGELYIAMELLQGQSLDDLVSGGQAVPPERVDRILGQVCGSLQEAHDKGIVHRDLKPANIFLTTRAGEEDVVKVLDFGIAKRDSKDSKQEQKLTQQGTILGTPPYMSPEQFTGKELDPRSDIYSLGVVVYEMLTGRLPFEADTPWQWMTQHMSAQPFPFETIPMAANVPHKMKQAVMRALAKDPAQRPESARDFFEDLTLGGMRMSAVGLGTGGVAAMPSPPTQALSAATGGGARAGGTQIGEPLFPDAPPGGAGKTMGFDPMQGAPMGGPQYAVAQAPVPTGGGQVYPTPPQRQQKSGGSGLIIAIVAVVALAGGVGGFMWWRGQQASASADEDDGTVKLPSAKPSATEEASTTATATATNSAAATPSATASETSTASASATASAVASTSATTTTTTTATHTTTASSTAHKPQQGIDACCARQRKPNDKRICNRINAGIKNGTIDRAAGLGTLRGQGVNCS